MRWWLAIVVAVLAGCGPSLPRYPAMAPAEALALMRARDGQVRSMSSTATVTLRDAGGSSVSFDAAIVAQWPDHLRLRAWKFGSAAFDLTLTPEGLWVYIPEEVKRRAGESANFELSAEQFLRGWSLIGPAVLDGAAARSEAGSLVATRLIDTANPEGGRVELLIDSPTLTTRRLRVFDAQGTERQTVEFERYAVHGTGEGPRIVWPSRMTAVGDQGRIQIRLGTPEFNGEIPAEAFVPPRRATRRPLPATDSGLGK